MSPGSDRYRLGAVIGVGGTAEVREAWRVDAPDALPVAVKLARPEHAGRRDVREDLRREADLLATLEHPGIVRALPPAGDDDLAAGYNLAMELLPGGSLQRLLGARVALCDAAGLLGDVADALGWLHRRGIVHADVKPANLLRDAGGRVKLIDFEAAATPDAPRRRRIVTAYAAPDLALGLAPDPRDDVFSLGVVLYQMLAARHPFAGDPVPALAAPVRPAGLDDEAWRWLRAAMAPARADRPRDPVELVRQACPA
ncbi:MAG: serine/threonine-protein kinase [Acetobacteraceae bacterium]